jgi:hypothetical protein
MAPRSVRRAIAEAKQRWSVIGWVTKSLFSQAPPCFGRHVKLLVPTEFVVVSTHFSFNEGLVVKIIDKTLSQHDENTYCTDHLVE